MAQMNLTRQQRMAGVLIPVFSIRGDRDLGIGDVSTLREFIDFSADLGFRYVQILPINETGPDNSPYNAISSVALEPMTLDCSPAALEDLSAADFDGICEVFDLDAMREGAVDYEQVRKLKLSLLKRAFDSFWENHYEKGTERDKQFGTFCKDESNWLNDYSVFRMLMAREGNNQNWQEWDERYRTQEGATDFITELFKKNPEKTDQQVSFFAYVQWVAFQQWRELSAYAREKGVFIMGDIPYGISVCSVDVFANREIFDLDWYGGAPPEQLFKDDEFVQKWGQNWGIPLYRWDVMEANGFEWWKQRIAKTVDICGMFRVDHALGFYRIYSFPWNPIRNDEFLPLSGDEAAERCDGRRPGFRPRPDESDEEKAANRADGERYFRMIKEAAGEAEVIAEDLGMVPDYVCPSLDDLQIAGMKVPQWEFTGVDVTPGVHYPTISFATYATHDHAPIAAQWNDARQKMADVEHESDEWWESRNFLHVLCQFAGIHVMDNQFPEFDRSVQEDLLRHLSLSNSNRIGIMISDLLGTTERINVPGTMDGSNWSYRLDMTVEELRNSEEWQWMRDLSKKLLNDTGRMPSL